MTEEVRAVAVEAAFRHSAGRLGSHFLRAIRDEGRLYGWRTGTPPRVMVPPKDLGAPGEWVAIGPGARLEAYAPTDWLPEPGGGDSCVALVMPDGADTALLARLRPAAGAGALAAGARLVAHFAAERTGAMTDFWFEPA
ncbi:MAG TPA: hypothetical protein VHD15_15310 [Hyphomicrobiales bacterium]|nr:hypothetical protein [Hyphomicrobiales bacterium]